MTFKWILGMLSLGAAAVRGLCVGFVYGVGFGQFSVALSENKLAIGNLDRFPDLDPQFRKYLKGRIYNNVREFYPPWRGYRERKDWDRGPVDLCILGGVHAVTDPTDPVWDWQSALVRACGEFGELLRRFLVT